MKPMPDIRPVAHAIERYQQRIAAVEDARKRLIDANVIAYRLNKHVKRRRGRKPAEWLLLCDGEEGAYTLVAVHVVENECQFFRVITVLDGHNHY